MVYYNSIISTTPPTSGNFKRLWSPELFDHATGTYPKSSPPSVRTYPTSGNSLQYYEGSEVAPDGFIQVSFSGASPGENGFWIAEFEIMDTDRNILASLQACLGSQAYFYRPEATSPYYFISVISYSDATMGETSVTGGNDQKSAVSQGDYIIRFTSLREYTQTSAAASPDTSATFSYVETTTIPTMEHNVSVIQSQTTSSSFSKT